MGQVDLGADAVLAAPAHQFPAGAVLSAYRRHALVEWDTAHDGLVLEDDYDAEFRYDRAGVGAVQGLDLGRVAHVGSTATTKTSTTRVVSCLLWILDRTAMMFQHSPAQRGMDGEMTFVIPSR
jgi:hypothetical protein